MNSNFIDQLIDPTPIGLKYFYTESGGLWFIITTKLKWHGV